MEPWYSGAVVEAVREAKSRRALFIVYVRDDSEEAQGVDQLWTNVWTTLNDTSKIVALRLDKATEACDQFTAIYKVQTYPTIYFINGQNGQVLRIVNQTPESAKKLEEIIEDALNTIEPKQQQTKTVDEKVAEARTRLKQLQDKRDTDAKEKEKQDEVDRRRLGQQMLSDKQKKDEELIRKQAEEFRRDKLEQQKLQEKLKAQIQADREEKRRKYEQDQPSPKPKVTTSEIETPKINYTRSRLQFRLTDGSFFTEDFSADAHINDVYAYLHETLPADQYEVGAYVLRTTHTRVILPRDEPKTLKELDLVPSAVLLVLSRGNKTSPAVNAVANNVFQSIPLFFAWLMMQLNFFYRLISEKLFGNRPAATGTDQSTARRTTTTTATKKENFRTDTTERSTIRRFHNTQDESDDEEKKTWNGNSTQQL